MALGLAGEVASRNVFGVGIVAQDAEGRLFLDFDAIGNAIGASDMSGEYSERNSYLPFGRAISLGTSSSLSLRTGAAFGMTSESDGRVLTESRHIFSEFGRFMSPDPAGRIGSGTNFYQFASNDPVQNTDVSGFISINPTWILNGTMAWISRGKTIEKSARLLNAALDGKCDAIFEVVGGLVGGLIAQSPFGRIGQVIGTAIDVNREVGTRGFFESFGRHSGRLLGGIAGISLGSQAGRALGSLVCPPDSNPPPPPPTPPTSPGVPVSSPIAGAVDPNALYGPAGFGPQHFVAGDDVLPYRIEFENYGPGSLNDDGTPVSPDRWATAPAQRVVITNALSADFDLSTFRYTGFGFGDLNISVASPGQSWQQILSMSYQGRTFEVWFEAGIDYASRELRMVFQSIDPQTFLPPDVLTGFLPPEDGTGRGKGFVTYTVAPLAALPTGTEIRNIALIQFDGQVFIATNQIDPLDPSQGTDPEKEALVTIDAGVPFGTVDPLPVETNTPDFLVRWNGQDDVGGSGVASYSVFVAVDGAPYQPWLVNTAQTAATYAGQFGRHYAFFVVATDSVGNTQAVPAQAQAETTLVPVPPRLGSILVNDGNVQRSMVTSLSITFSTAVNLLDGALALIGRDQPFKGRLHVANPNGDRRTWVITFSGTGTEAGSLADGVYTLAVNTSRIYDDFGRSPTVPDQQFTFHRLFGDIDGDRDVDAKDLAYTRRSLGSRLGDANYFWWLDRDGDGDIDTFDGNGVRKNLGIRYVY